MLIFLSVVATTLGAVSLTSDTVLASGPSGGGDGTTGNGHGNNSGEYRSKYKTNDGGYRIFLVPSQEHMYYKRDVSQGDEVSFKWGNDFFQEDWMTFSKQKESDNLVQAKKYYSWVYKFARLGAYEIHTHDVNNNLASYTSIHSYKSGKSYLPHYNVDISSQMMGNSLDRVMNFSGIFGGSTPKLNNFDSWTFNHGDDVSGSISSWSKKMFLTPTLAEYEKRVQQIKNWMKQKKSVYAKYGDKFIAAYNTIMSTPNSDLDIVIEPLLLVHDRNDNNHVVVYSYTDVLMATKNGQGVGVKSIYGEPLDVDNRDYSRDFGTRDIPSAHNSLHVWNNFHFNKPYQKAYVNTRASKYRIKNGKVGLWIGSGGDAYRVGFIHYTPFVFQEKQTAQMGVSHNITIVDSSDVLGTQNNSSSSTVSIDANDVKVSYGSAIVASTAETQKNTAKEGSPAYDVFNTSSRLNDWDKIYKTSTATVKNPDTGKNTALSSSTFQKLVYSVLGVRHVDELGIYATNPKSDLYNKNIDTIGGVSYAKSSESVKGKVGKWFYGTNKGVAPKTYGDWMYAGAAGMQLGEWMEITKDNVYDITQVSTAKLTHSGISNESKGFPYYALSVGTENADGYMANHIRSMNKNFQKTAKRVPLASKLGTNVLGASYTNTISYKGNSNPLSGIFGNEIVKYRNEHFSKYTDLTTDKVTVSYVGKSLKPTADASTKMSSNNDTAKKYKRTFLYNLWGLTAASSRMSVSKNGGSYSIQPQKGSYETISVAVLQKKETVTSNIAFARLEVKKQSKNDRIGNYSLAQTGGGTYKKYNVASNGLFKVDPQAGMGAVMSGSSKEKTYHYLVSWEGTQVPTNSAYDFSKSSRESVAQAIGSALASYANNVGGLGQGTSTSVSRLKSFFKTEVGVDLKLVVKKDTKNTWTLATGASQNAEGKLAGYNSMVISWEDDEFEEIAEDGLRPHELNVLLPDLLGFTHIYGNKDHKYATADEIHPIPTVVIDVRWHHWYENGGVRSTSHLHCSIPYTVEIPVYEQVWIPGHMVENPNTVDPDGNMAGSAVWVPGHYEEVFKGYRYETRYNDYYYNTYWYQSSHGDMTDRYDYNVVPPYQIWDKFEGTGIWNKIPNGKNTAFFYYNKTGNFRPRSGERSHDFSPGESTMPSYLYSLSRRVWDDMVVGCNFVGSLSTDDGSYGTYRQFMNRTLGLDYGNKPSGRTYKVGANNTKLATEKRWDTITFEIVPHRYKTNEGGAVETSRTYYMSSSCGYCKATFTSKIVDLTGSRGDTESSCTRYNGHGWRDETLKKGFYYNGSDQHVDATYTINHYMTKYNCIGKPSGTIGVENKIHRAQNGTDRFEWNVLFEEEADQSLHIYPEVEMRLYHATDSSSGAANPRIVNNTYAMGEKERDFAATSLRLVNLKGSDGSFYNGSNDRKFLTAKLTSDTVAQTGDAKSLQSSHRTDDGRLLPIIYAGGNYNLKIRNEFNIEVISYTLDIEDTHNGVTIKGGSAGFDSRNDIWSTTKIRQAHLQTVTSIINGLELSMKMQTTTGYSGRFSSSPVKTYNDLKIAGTKIKTPETVANDVFHLKFKEGAYLENGTGKYTLEGLRPLIQDVAREYNISESEARKVVEDSGIVKSVKMALESRFDANNHSTVEKGFHDGNKWYDEESSVIIVRKLKSKINLGDVVVTDKVDLTAGPKRTKADRSNFFQNSYNAAFYYYLNLKTSELNLPDDADDPNALMWKLANGSFVDVSKYKAVVDAFHVKDGDFLIPTATTSDMRNNI